MVQPTTGTEWNSRPRKTIVPNTRKLMDNRKNLDTRIRDLMQEGPLVALYLKVGIDILQEQTTKMNNEELFAMFGSLLSTERLRGNIRFLYNRLNDLPEEYQSE